MRSSLLLLLSAAALLAPSQSFALYSLSKSDYELNLIGFAGFGGGVAKFPDDDVLYDEHSADSWYGDLRLIADGGVGDQWSAQVNILQNVRSTPIVQYTGYSFHQKDVERSGLFFWQQHDTPNSQAAMVLDTGYCKYGTPDNELVVGRQPVSTSVTFFFTPNDFFAPFSPNAFFRVYKPGVDGIRFERRLALLSQLSVVGVLGYDDEPDSDSGWSSTPDWERTSLLARLTHSAGLFEWGVLSGVVRESLVTGFSLQGELFQWLGLRAEGNYAHSWDDGQDSGFMAAAGVEHRFPSSMHVRLEQMYNGYGYDSIDEALAARTFAGSGQGYLGRHYSALGIGYELTPLLFGEMQLLHNWSDESSLFSLYAVYSVSDESELAVTAAFPGGSDPDAGAVHSELGALPFQLLLEFRHYF